MTWGRYAERVGFVLADQVDDEQAGGLREAVVQRHQDACYILVEVFDMQISHVTLISATFTARRS